MKGFRLNKVNLTFGAFINSNKPISARNERRLTNKKSLRRLKRTQLS